MAVRYNGIGFSLILVPTSGRDSGCRFFRRQVWEKRRALFPGRGSDIILGSLYRR